MSVIWRAGWSSAVDTYGVYPTATTLVTAPTEEPITLSEAKAHCRERQNDENALFSRWIGAARRRCEAETGLTLITQTWDVIYDGYPSYAAYPIYLPFMPIQSITSVSYLDEDGDAQTWSSAEYRLIPANTPPSQRAWAQILPVYDGEYPTEVRDITRALTVRVVAGFGNDGSYVPEDLITDMLALIGTWATDGRQTVISGTIISPVPGVGLFSAYRSVGV